MPTELTPYQNIPCCPDLDTDPVYDVLDMRRRLVFPTSVRTANEHIVRVEVILHTRFTRCAGPLALGELVYSTTLLPSEKVRLATTDRRSRFSYDGESKLSYRHEQISEEQYRMTALRAFMADENVVDRSRERSTEQSKWDFQGDAGGSIAFFSASVDAHARGSYNGEATRDYLREHRSHAETSDHQSVEATRQAHSLSIGEVSTRAHQPGESEDHFESSSREFSNPNQCHAVTFLCYRINKTETLRFSLESIERRVLDPVAVTPIAANPIRALGHISTIPQAVPATNKERLEIEERGLRSEAQYAQAANIRLGDFRRFAVAPVAVAEPEIGTQTPLPKEIRDAALAEVDQQLVDAGLLDEVGGKLSPQAQEEFGYERQTSLPTAGVIVKGCLDECSVCEPTRMREIELDLEHKQLENDMLKRKIELLEKSQA